MDTYPDPGVCGGTLRRLQDPCPDRGGRELTRTRLELAITCQVRVDLPQYPVKSLTPAAHELIDEVGHLCRSSWKHALHVRPPPETILVLPALVVLDHPRADVGVLGRCPTPSILSRHE